ncbi:unnamed protein product, partial [Vitis vinifera]
MKMKHEHPIARPKHSPSSAVPCSSHLSLPFAPIHQLSFLSLLLSSKSTTLTHSLKPNKNSRLTFSLPYSHLSLKPLNLIKHIYHTQLLFFFLSLSSPTLIHSGSNPFSTLCWLTHFYGGGLRSMLCMLDVSVFFCYKNPHDQSVNGRHGFSFGSMVGALKIAMSQALVSYYAFSGEVVSNSAGEPELLCNNRGVDFMEAHADVRLENLNLYNPDVSIEGKLVPKKENGVLSVQVTELKCSGVVVACTFDHRIADAYSANMFLVSWAEMAQSKPLSVTPAFRRSLLNTRRPGSYDPSFDNMYVPISALPPSKAPQPSADPLMSRLYYVTAEQLSLLQMLATSKSSSCKRTKLESLSAFLWKMVAKKDNR